MFRSEVNLVKLQKALIVADKIAVDIDRLFEWAKAWNKILGVLTRSLKTFVKLFAPAMTRKTGNKSSNHSMTNCVKTRS